MSAPIAFAEMLPGMMQRERVDCTSAIDKRRAFAFGFLGVIVAMFDALDLNLDEIAGFVGDYKVRALGRNGLDEAKATIRSRS